MNENEHDTPPAAPESPSPQTGGDPTPRDWGKIAIIAGFALLLLLLVWQTVAVSRVAASKEEALRKAQSAQVAALDQAKKEAGVREAEALAAGLHQLFLLRSQYPDLSDRVFQAVCGELAADGAYDFVAVTDSTRRILGSSDLTRVGTTFASPFGTEPTAEKAEGHWEVRAPVLSEDAILGGVVLRLR